MPSQVRLGYRRSDTPALSGRNWTFLESQPQSRSLVLHLRPESIEVRYCLQETTRNFQHPIDRSGNPDAGRSKSMWLENQRAHCRLNSLMPTSWYIYFYIQTHRLKWQLLPPLSSLTNLKKDRTTSSSKMISSWISKKGSPLGPGTSRQNKQWTLRSSGQLWWWARKLSSWGN